MQASVLPLTYTPALMAAITVLLVTTAARMPQNLCKPLCPRCPLSNHSPAVTLFYCLGAIYHYTLCTFSSVCLPHEWKAVFQVYHCLTLKPEQPPGHSRCSFKKKKLTNK